MVGEEPKDPEPIGREGQEEIINFAESKGLDVRETLVDLSHGRALKEKTDEVYARSIVKAMIMGMSEAQVKGEEIDVDLPYEKGRDLALKIMEAKLSDEVYNKGKLAPRDYVRHEEGEGIYQTPIGNFLLYRQERHHRDERGVEGDLLQSCIRALPQG